MGSLDDGNKSRIISYRDQEKGQIPSRIMVRLNNSPATGDFYFQASDGLVTLPAAGYDYDIDWTPMSAGLAPAGMAASFAALAHQAAGQGVLTV